MAMLKKGTRVIVKETGKEATVTGSARHFKEGRYLKTIYYLSNEEGAVWNNKGGRAVVSVCRGFLVDKGRNCFEWGDLALALTEAQKLAYHYEHEEEMIMNHYYATN